MLKRLALVSLGLLVGVILGALCTYSVMRKVTHNWIGLSKDGLGVAYLTAVFEADIPMPELKNLNGQAKFVDRGVGKGTELGFLVKVSMEKLDTSKLPEKYKKSQSLGQITIGPTETVVYSGHVEFTFKDVDGFTLVNTKSEQLSIWSGKYVSRSCSRPGARRNS